MFGLLEQAVLWMQCCCSGRREMLHSCHTETVVVVDRQCLTNGSMSILVLSEQDMQQLAEHFAVMPLGHSRSV